MINYSQYRSNETQYKLYLGEYSPLDVVLVGATGTGKSSTINALFGQEVSAVGSGCNPQTMKIAKHYLAEGKMRFWDTPGLGDSPQNDLEYSKELTNLLNYSWNDGRNGYIDLAVVILDGSSRDLGVAYSVLTDVVLNSISPERVLVMINQADMAMKGRHWDCDNQQPRAELEQFHQQQALSVQSRIQRSTGLTVPRPICYSATSGYNISGFLDLIIDNIPSSRRVFSYHRAQ